MRPPFPSVIDSTIISAFRDCPQKAFRQYIEHWKPGEESIHLVAGGAFASGLEAARRSFYTDGASPSESAAVGLGALWKHYGWFDAGDREQVKTWDRMAGALEFYFDRYPLGSDGATPHFFGDRHGIEFSFAEPLPVSHPESGDPIIFAGRADMVADAFGGLMLYDEKTTSQLGRSWIDSWEHRSQFTSYCWGLRGHGIHPTGIVVRGVSILKNDYGTEQVITYRSDWEVDRWLFQVTRDLKRMIECWHEGYWDYNLDHACTSFGGCSLKKVCKSPDPEKWLNIYFKKRVWDPLSRTEVKLPKEA